MTFRELLNQRELPPREMLILVAHRLGMDQAEIYRDLDRQIPAAQLRQVRRDAERRRAGWPLQYLTGRAWFWSLPLEVGRGVLVPRPETETLVEAALRRAPAGGRLADVGTGSGAILAAIAVERPDLRLIGVEKSPVAMRYAERNLEGRADLVLGDLCAPLAEPQDVIVANLPYVRLDEYPRLPDDVRREPRMALVSGADGLALIRRLVRQAPSHLKPGGWLLLEIGAGQGDAVAENLSRRGFTDIFRQEDLGGIERVVGGRWPCAPN
jgi:release factor glutamine methyltransferase